MREIIILVMVLVAFFVYCIGIVIGAIATHKILNFKINKEKKSVKMLKNLKKE